MFATHGALGIIIRMRKYKEKSLGSSLGPHPFSPFSSLMMEMMFWLAAVQKSHTVMSIVHVHSVIDEQPIEVHNCDTVTKQAF